MADILRKEGYSVFTFCTGKSVMEAMSQNPQVNLLIIDVMLPEMDGLAVLQALRRSARWAKLPALLLSASEEREQVVRAAKLEIRGFLLKSRFSVEMLLLRVKEILDPRAAATVSRTQTPAPVSAGKQKRAGTLSKADTQARTEKYLLDKTLAGTLSEVLAVTASAECNPSDLIRVIEHDGPLAARILEVAKSAVGGSATGSIVSMNDAVRKMGLRAIRNIAVNIGFFAKFPPSAKDGFNLIHFWRHGMAVGSIMDWLLPSSPAAPGPGYVVGLCHDLAEMALRQGLSEEYDSALKEAESNSETFEEAKAAMFGILPHELSNIVLTRLGLPAPLRMPIVEYQMASVGGSVMQMGPIARALRMADVLANGLMLANTPHSTVCPAFGADCKDAIGTASPVLMELAPVRESVLAQSNLLAHIPPEEESRLSRALFPLSKLAIGYVRHPLFSTFDPLCGALELLANVQTLDAIPESVGVSGTWDGMVIAVPEAGQGEFGVREIGRFRKLEPRNIPILYLSITPAVSLPGQITGLHAGKLPISLKDLAQWCDRLVQSPGKAAA
jgi:CheY-like chemotaxis protein